MARRQIDCMQMQQVRLTRLSINTLELYGGLRFMVVVPVYRLAMGMWLDGDCIVRGGWLAECNNLKVDSEEDWWGSISLLRSISCVTPAQGIHFILSLGPGICFAGNLIDFIVVGARVRVQVFMVGPDPQRSTASQSASLMDIELNWIINIDA